MKTIQIISIGTVLLTALNVHAKSGDKVGGGGYALVCRDAKGEVTSAKLLEVAEAQAPTAEHGYGCSLPDTGDESAPAAVKALRVDQILSDADARTKVKFPLLATAIQEGVDYVRDPLNQRPLLRNTVLASPEDIGEMHLYVFPNGCRPEPVGRYTPAGTLLIDTNILDKMSSTSIAAFWRHESIYRLERAAPLSRTDSESSRALNIAYLTPTAGSCDFRDATFDLQKDAMEMEVSRPGFSNKTKYSCDVSSAPKFFTARQYKRGKAVGFAHEPVQMEFTLRQDYPTGRVAIVKQFEYISIKTSKGLVDEGVVFGFDSTSEMIVPFTIRTDLPFFGDKYSWTPTDVASLAPVSGSKNRSYFAARGHFDQVSQVITFFAHDGAQVTCVPVP